MFCDVLLSNFLFQIKDHTDLDIISRLPVKGVKIVSYSGKSENQSFGGRYTAGGISMGREIWLEVRKVDQILSKCATLKFKCVCGELVFSCHWRALWTALSQEEEQGELRRRRGVQNECFWNNSGCAILIWTKSGMDILLNTSLWTNFSFFSKSKMAAATKMATAAPWWSVFGITRNEPFRFGQNLTWSYYLTLETSLQKKFSFFSKSKMATAAAIMPN